MSLYVSAKYPLHMEPLGAKNCIFSFFLPFFQEDQLHSKLEKVAQFIAVYIAVVCFVTY